MASNQDGQAEREVETSKEFRPAEAGLGPWEEEVRQSLKFLQRFSVVLLCYTGITTGLSFLIFLFHGFKVYGFRLPDQAASLSRACASIEMQTRQGLLP